MLRHGHKATDMSIGARYRRRDAPNLMWEVLSLYVGVDGLPHAILSNVADPTQRKTLSQFTLENGGLYSRVAER